MQAQNANSKILVVLAHIFAWALFGLAIFYYRPVISDIDIPAEFWIKQTIELGLLMIVFYFNAFVLVPTLLLKNKHVIYFIIALGILVSILYANRVIDRNYADSQRNQIREFRTRAKPSNVPEPPIFIPGGRGGLGITLTATITTLVLGISTALTAIQKWQKDNQQRKELEKEKVSTELSLLKAQIHPHFFFNTLNNIYVLTSEDPKVAGEAVHQLSKMMRYLLYDTQQSVTLLSQEIAFVNNYISLMKLRLTDAVKITIEIPDQLQDTAMAPMLFLPFVENAFKHGVSATEPSFIQIVVSQNKNTVELKIKNSIRKDSSNNRDENGGIGLANTRRRLDLLYPGNYSLKTNEAGSNNEYTVLLILNLS